MKFMDLIRKKLDKKTVHPMLDTQWTNMEILKGLRQNGVLIERARMEKRSLGDDMNRVLAFRELAADHGFTKEGINALEMEGERDKELVLEPIKVKVKFAYWNSGCYGFPAYPDYLILESNHPSFPKYGNVSRQVLEKNNIKIPKTPTFEQWDKAGRPCFRG